MIKKHSALILGIFFGLSFVFCSKEQTIKPNFLFILTDDQGWSQLGCYGSTFYDTPNIDGLAEQGMSFTDAYAAAPVCSPTRASIMTGKYPARVHLTDYIAGDKKGLLNPPNWTKHLPLEEVTIAERLKEKGYATALFGKWHLSKSKKPPESEPFNPDKQGFDESFVTYKPSPGLAQPWQTPENDAHNVKIITEKALGFLERNRSAPFLLVLSHNTIHRPVAEKAKLIEKYQAKPGSALPQNNPTIGAMLETLDHSVGMVLAKLDELGLSERTVVFFFSDNGGFEEDADQAPLRAGKGWLYEGGIRVPLIVRWPGRVEPASKCSEPVISIDFFPTILELAGIKYAPSGIDGVSLLPVLLKTGLLRRDRIFWHYPHYSPQGGPPCGAIRSGDYKLIEWYERSLLREDKAVSLFNLRKDIGEQEDLTLVEPQKTSELQEELALWRRSVGAQMPEPGQVSSEK